MSHIMKGEACDTHLSGFGAELYHVLGDRGVQELGRIDGSGNGACQLEPSLEVEGPNTTNRHKVVERNHRKRAQGRRRLDGLTSPEDPDRSGTAGVLPELKDNPTTKNARQQEPTQLGWIANSLGSHTCVK